MTKKKSPLWDAPPHTIAKIEILKNYLNAWFPIVGSKFQELVYVDGFAGPGKYSNHSEGSPLAALKVLSSRIAKDPDRISISKITAIFIEANRARHQILTQNIKEIPLPARIEPRSIPGEFAPVMTNLFTDPSLAPAFNGNQPLLVFADPFGGTGVPFHLVEKCLKNPSSELILNFDADGIARIHSGQNPKWKDQLDEVFGCRDWDSWLDSTENLALQSQKAIALYKELLLKISGVNFVWTFEMRGRTDRISYYLVFASRNRLGMEKMKEAMRAIDATGQYCFSDAHVGQHVLFRADNAEHFAKTMHGTFLGKSLSYAAVDHYVLCETPFSNPKRMLDWLSRNSRIKVQARVGKTIKAHTFPEDHIDTITFVNPPQQVVQSTLF